MSTLLNKILRERKHRPDTARLRPVGRRTSRTDVRLAFLYQYEAGTDAAPLLRFELLGAYWFRRIWERYLCVFGNRSLPDALRGAVGPRILPGFPRLPENLRHDLYKTHLRYVTRMLQAADPAPVALAELIAGASILPSKYLHEGDWYVVEYLAGGPLPAPRQPVEEGEMVHATIGLSTDRDGPPRRSRIVRIVPLTVEDPALHVLLQALHFPQANPQAEPESRRAASGTPHIHMHMRGRLGVRTDDGEVPLTFRREDYQPPLPPRLLTALLGAGAHGRPRTKVAAPSPAGSYIAGGQFATAAPSGSPQQLAVNPMACMPGQPQPFIGINMIGAGNNTALHGRNGIVAYVDFGAPAPANADTVPPGVADPCICGDPLMILSHWDYDHYAMARKADGAWRCRWIAPQQIMGSVSARELYVRLLVEAPNGGALALWPAGACGGGPSHWQVPFGFIERGTGAPVNDDCLAVHVRLQDDPTMAPVAAWTPPFAHRPSPSPAVSPSPRRAVIVDNCVPAAWIDDAVGSRFRKLPVVVPDSANLLTTPQRTLKPGEQVSLTAADPAVAGTIPARWIPPAGLALPAHIGGTYVPVLPNQRTWPGGWAISASDFVRLGGCIVDFPTNASGIPIDNIICVSPTAGTMWDPDARPPGAQPLATATSLSVVKPKRWKPVWGSGGWALQVPAAGAAALAPLPAGPVAISPVPGAAPMNASESYVLLPGDAGYQHLPALQARVAASGIGHAAPPIVGMVATHHGSASWIPKHPADAALATAHIPAAGAAKIVYSYGTRMGGATPGAHCYDGGGEGHPQSAAIAAYLAAGWGMPAVPVAFAFNRLNTAPYDFESNQPFNPLALPSGMQPSQANVLGHYNGNVALGLGTKPPGASVIRTCPHCNQARTYYF